MGKRKSRVREIRSVGFGRGGWVSVSNWVVRMELIEKMRCDQRLE